MEHILEQFRLHANKYEIDTDTGGFILIPGTNERKPNPKKTWDKAWEIPCIIVYAGEVDRIKIYDRVRKISFDVSKGIVSLIIGNKWHTPHAMDETKSLVIPSFEDYLRLKNYKFDEVDSNYFVNRVFFNWINDINWARVSKTKELHKNMFEDVS